MMDFINYDDYEARVTTPLRVEWLDDWLEQGGPFGVNPFDGFTISIWSLGQITKLLRSGCAAHRHSVLSLPSAHLKSRDLFAPCSAMPRVRYLVDNGQMLEVFEGTPEWDESESLADSQVFSLRASSAIVFLFFNGSGMVKDGDGGIILLHPPGSRFFLGINLPFALLM